MRVTVAVGAWGQRQYTWPNPLVPFVSQPGMGGGSPAVSPVVAAGDEDGRSAPLLQGELIWVFIV